MGFNRKTEYICDLCGFSQTDYDSYPPPSGFTYGGDIRSFTTVYSNSIFELNKIVCSKCIKDSLMRPPQPPCQPESRTVWKGF